VTATRLVVWNAERKSASGPVGRRIKTRLERFGADVCIITEAEAGLMPEGGHTVTSEAMPFGRFREPERKVVMWSRQRWTEQVAFESPSHFAARTVCARTTTPIGPLWVCGVCIPWRGSRVRFSDEKRRPWEDHLAHLDRLGPVLEDLASRDRSVVAGDFNQHVPRAGQPKRVYERLVGGLAEPWSIVTKGIVPDIDDQVIDHLAVNASLVAKAVAGVPHTDGGRRLSDHTGVVVELRAAMVVGDADS